MMLIIKGIVCVFAAVGIAIPALLLWAVFATAGRMSAAEELSQGDIVLCLRATGELLAGCSYVVLAVLANGAVRVRLPDGTVYDVWDARGLLRVS